MLKRFLFIFFFIFIVITYGFVSPRRLSPLELDIITSSGFSNHFVEFNDEQLYLSEADFRKCLKALLPVGDVLPFDGRFEIFLNYQAGNMPVSIAVYVDDDKLIYKIDDFVYSGGDPIELQDIIDKYISEDVADDIE